MKRNILFLSAALFLNVLGTVALFAQSDDVYYDPKNDKANQYSKPQAPPSSPDNYSVPNNQPEDKTDGYATEGNNNPAYKYDEKDKSYSNSYQDDNLYASNAYSDGYEDYYYTSRLRRYYVPNYGVDYFSYWFTPSFYFGWSNWNTGVYVTYSPWYNDSWWRWNRPYRNRIFAYDPWFDPYWSYNWGWNSCSYYNSWGNPYGGWCGTSGWGYNPYSWNYYGCGWSRNGWGNRYYSNYWNGYNQGYGYGYNDGYWNGSRYNSSYYGPRHRNGVKYGNESSNAGGGGQNPNSGGNTGKTNPVKPIENILPIPREGITKPFVPDNSVKTQDLFSGKQNDPKLVKPIEPIQIQPKQNIGQFDNSNKINTQPGINNNAPRQNENQIQRIPENRNWDRNNDVAPMRPQENIQRVKPEPIPQPRMIEQPKNFEPRERNAPRNEAPRMDVAPRQNIERVEPRMRNVEPRQDIQRVEPRQNIQRMEPQQRNFEQPRMQMRESPSFQQVQPHNFNSSGGGGKRPR